MLLHVLNTPFDAFLPGLACRCQQCTQLCYCLGYNVVNHEHDTDVARVY